MADRVNRKDFVALVGTAVALETLPAASTAEAATAKRPAPAKPLGSEPEASTFLTEPESAFATSSVIVSEGLAANRSRTTAAKICDWGPVPQIGTSQRSYSVGAVFISA